VPRIALEVIFLVVVAAVVAVAKFSSLEIVAVMAGAVVITFLVELIAARDRPSTTPIPAAPSVRPAAPAPRAPEKPLVAAKKEPVPAAVEESTAADELPAPSRADLEEELPPVGEPSLALAQPDPAVEDEPPPADDGSGWAAFAEPAGPEPLTVMGALSEDEEPALAATPDEPPQPLQTANVQEAEPEPEPEAEHEPDAELDLADVTEEETGMIARRGRLRRRKREVRPHEPPAPAPKHVRVLPAPETTVAEAELPPWERGFDDTEERR
jgi:ribonuclease E